MNSQVLSKRRKVFPVESVPCRVPQWYLNFDVEGVPYFEPCFASISTSVWRGARDASELHAVAHRITPKDFIRIQNTEGGGGHAGLGYDPVLIKAELYDGRVVETITLVHINQCKNFYAWPSKRYHDLIVNGAKESKLDEKYIDYLESIPVYSRPKNLSTSFSLLICMGPFFLLVATPVLFVWFTCRFIESKLNRLTGKTFRAPRPVYAALSVLLNLCFEMHNRVWRHICGDGYHRDSSKRAL